MGGGTDKPQRRWSVATTRRNGQLSDDNIPSDQTFSEAGSSSLKENSSFVQFVQQKGLLPFSSMNKAMACPWVSRKQNMNKESGIKRKLMDQWGSTMNKQPFGAHKSKMQADISTREKDTQTLHHYTSASNAHSFWYSIPQFFAFSSMKKLQRKRMGGI